MNEKEIEAKAKELQREYRRSWARKNRDKVRATNKRYWEKKARGIIENERCETNNERNNKPVAPSFKEWIQKYAKRDTPKGDVTRDILADKEFPDANGADSDRMLQYLHERNAESVVIDIFSDMYDDYLDECYSAIED